MRGKMRLALMGAVVFAGGFFVTGVLLSVLDGAGGSAPPASAGQLRWTVEDARAFQGFPLYWLGESYEGLPLTTIIRYQYDPDPPKPAAHSENSVTFIYGSCTPSAAGGCPPPLSIVVELYCMRPPELFAPAVRSGEPFYVGGALAEYMGLHLRIWTENVTISILEAGIGGEVADAEQLTVAERRRAAEQLSMAEQLRAAEQLRLVSEGPAGALKPLGSPNVDC